MYTNIDTQVYYPTVRVTSTDTLTVQSQTYWY